MFSPTDQYSYRVMIYQITPPREFSVCSPSFPCWPYLTFWSGFIDTSWTLLIEDLKEGKKKMNNNRQNLLGSETISIDNVGQISMLKIDMDDDDTNISDNRNDVGLPLIQQQSGPNSSRTSSALCSPNAMAHLRQQSETASTNTTSNTNTACSTTTEWRKQQSFNALKLPFPWKLFQLLEDLERDGRQDIAAWLPGGKAFRINNPDVFSRQIMPNYFRQTKLTSFVRQLYIYGFSKIESGPEMGGYHHPSFQRDNQFETLSLGRNQVEKDRRCKKKGKGNNSNKKKRGSIGSSNSSSSARKRKSSSCTTTSSDGSLSSSSSPPPSPPPPRKPPPKKTSSSTTTQQQQQQQQQMEVCNTFPPSAVRSNNDNMLAKVDHSPVRFSTTDMHSSMSSSSRTYYDTTKSCDGVDNVHTTKNRKNIKGEATTNRRAADETVSSNTLPRSSSSSATTTTASSSNITNNQQHQQDDSRSNTSSLADLLLEDPLLLEPRTIEEMISSPYLYR